MCDCGGDDDDDRSNADDGETTMTMVLLLLLMAIDAGRNPEQFQPYDVSMNAVAGDNQTYASYTMRVHEQYQIY